MHLNWRGRVIADGIEDLRNDGGVVRLRVRLSLCSCCRAVLTEWNSILSGDHLPGIPCRT